MNSDAPDFDGRAAPSTSGEFAALYVERVCVNDFRGIERCCVELEPDLTVLVGRNNAGKSRILRALALALGGVVADRDDLTVDGPTTATIDVVLAPITATGGEQRFPVRVARRLGRHVQTVSEDPVSERFAFRTTVGRSYEGFGVRADTVLLTFDQTTGAWQVSGNAPSPTLEQRTLVSADLVDTRRDLVEELSRRGSAIRRVLDDLEIAPERRELLESGLESLGGDIVEASASLAAVASALDLATELVGGIGRPSLQALPVRLEELTRSISINLDGGKGALPMRFHGSGARSLASIQVQGVLYDRRLGQDGRALRPHPVTLIEEPESHLHPQAQFDLASLLAQIRGQVVVSTHSTHLISVVEPRMIRILRDSDGLEVIDLCPVTDETPETPRGRRPALHFEEMEKLRRLVERPFGELLFASAVVLGDGATERALVPPLMRSALGDRAHGLCVVDPGSMNGAHAVAVVKFANLVGIPWLLFCDSDDAGRLAADQLVQAHGGGDATRIVWIRTAQPDGLPGEGAASERMLMDFDRDLCERACGSMGYDPNRQELVEFMKAKKGTLGRVLAAELLSKYPSFGPEEPSWPLPLLELLRKLDALLPPRGTARG